MAWFPGAIRKEVTRHRTAMESYRGICNHIAVSEGASLFNYFNQPGNPTSHFYVRYSGVVEQYVSTAYRAPAQLEGNPTMIGIETQGGVVAGQKWTAEQLETLAQIAAWCHKIHGIPLIPMTSSRPIATGVGYHRLGVDPYRVNGGERWSTSYGKTCPEYQRIEQHPYIITRARAIDAGGTEEPVTPEEIQAIASATTEAVWDKIMGDVPASTIMVRLNPGPNGITTAVSDKVWDKATTSALDNSPVKVLDLLRYAQGDSKSAAVTLAEGGAINAQLDQIQSTLVDEDMQTDRIEAKLNDPAALAAELAPLLPSTGPVTQEALETALRNVLGSLDGA